MILASTFSARLARIFLAALPLMLPATGPVRAADALEPAKVSEGGKVKGDLAVLIFRVTGLLQGHFQCVPRLQGKQ